MKHILTFILFMAAAFDAFCNDSLAVIYRIRLDQDIDKSSQRLVTLGLEKATEASADYVLLDLDTYGGAVDAADSIRSAILRYEKPVVAYINMQAASAGALISIACDSIYMKTGSSIGAATVVDQAGNVMPDKYQSFMRGMMRSTAQATGRDPKIAESMTDTANVLTLTPSEAVEVGYCEGIAESYQEVAAILAGDGQFVIKDMSEDMTWLDRLIQFLLNPFLQSIFMMMIVGGIFVEIRTPGIGLPLLTAVAGALLYFAPAYIGHLAEYWEILLFVVGLVLIALEIFVIPGFGVAGISGCRAGKVITDETSEEIVSADIFPGSVTPHIIIEYQIVGDDRTLKRYHRRYDVLSPIAFTEDEIRKQPEDKRVDKCAGKACPRIFKESLQEPQHGLSLWHRVHFCIPPAVFHYGCQIYYCQHKKYYDSNDIQ